MRSDIHNRLQDQLIIYYRSLGHIAMKEYFINGKKIDVLNWDGSNKLIIGNEIELSPKHGVDNIIRDLQAGCDEVRVFALNPTVLTQIKNNALRALDSETLSKVDFYLIKDFFQLNTTKTYTE